MLGLGTLVTLLLIGHFATRERVSYQERSIDSWFRELSFEALGRPTAARRAFRSIGSDAVPFVLEKLERQDSRIAQRLRKDLVRVESFLPARIIRLFESPTVDSQRALVAFTYLGAEGWAAVPTLAKYLDSQLKGFEAAFALGFIGPPAFPVLLHGLAHPNPRVRRTCAVALQLQSPTVDGLLNEFLNELGLEFNPNNSWANRSIFIGSLRLRVDDCYHLPAYPELEQLFQGTRLKRITTAAETVLESYDPEALIASSAYQSSLAFYDLANASAPLIDGIGPDDQTTAFFKRLDHTQRTFPERHYSCELLRLWVLLAQRRYDEATPILTHLEQRAGESWLRWRDLAFVLIDARPRPKRMRQAAIAAAEEAIRRSQGKDYFRVQLAVEAYQRYDSTNPRLKELEKLSQAGGPSKLFRISAAKHPRD